MSPDTHQEPALAGHPDPEWSVAILSSREDLAVLRATIDSVVNAAAGHSVTVDVLVNGNPDLAQRLAPEVDATPLPPRISVRVWSIAFGDKSNAWNAYVHTIWPNCRIAFFVDGYCRIGKASLKEMESTLEQFPEASAVSAIPSVGHSASRLARVNSAPGGIHGNLYGLRAQVVGTIRARKFRLPLGLYRTDPFLGAALCYDFEPATHRWNANRLVSCPAATWSFSPLSWWRPADIRTHWRRMLRQGQGRIENLAIRDHMTKHRRPPEAIGSSAKELLSEWSRRNPAHASRAVWLDPTVRLALKRSLAWSAPESGQAQPKLLTSSAARCNTSPGSSTGFTGSGSPPA